MGSDITQTSYLMNNLKKYIIFSWPYFWLPVFYVLMFQSLAYNQNTALLSGHILHNLATSIFQFLYNLQNSQVYINCKN
jgi:hypothetical protein